MSRRWSVEKIAAPGQDRGPDRNIGRAVLLHHRKRADDRMQFAPVHSAGIPAQRRSERSDGTTNMHHPQHAIDGTTARHAVALCLALLAALALAGCDKSAQVNPKAPGSPGTGNAREVLAPTAADAPSAGPAGLQGPLARAGSQDAGRDAVPGLSGKSTSDMGGRSRGARVGVHTAGGLGGSSGLGLTGSFPANGASAGTAGGSGDRMPGQAAGGR